MQQLCVNLKSARLLTISAAVLAALGLAVASSPVAFAETKPPAMMMSALDPVTGTHFAADPDMKAVLMAHAKLGPKPIENLSVAEARQQPNIADAVDAVLKDKGMDKAPEKLVPGVVSEDKTIPGPAGVLPIRVFTPTGKGPFPVIVYFHGGGWVIADKQVYDGGARGLAKAAEAVVVSVDYRRAPEAKFPAAWDDALAAYKYVATNAGSMNGDPKRLALAGESAGGNLAVSTAVAALAAGITAPKAILAVYPVSQTGDMATPSYADSSMAKPLNKAMIAWFVDKLLSKPADKSDPRLDVVHANLKGLPPVTIINAQIDPLRSDGVLLAQALKNAGVSVTHKEYTGVTHEFFGAAAVVAKAKEAQAFAGEQLKKSISQ